MATSIKEALRRWQAKRVEENAKLRQLVEENPEKAKEMEFLEENPEKAKIVELQFQIPPITKMDQTVSTLIECEHLSLSTNNIDRIANLAGLQNLKILALGRNNIKSLAGLDAVASTLEQLWISYNLIEKLGGVESLRKLRVLYITNNRIKDWNEVNRLVSLSSLEDLGLYGNPLHEATDPEKYRQEMIRRLPNLKMFEGEPILRTEEDVEEEVET